MQRRLVDMPLDDHLGEIAIPIPVARDCGDVWQ